MIFKTIAQWLKGTQKHLHPQHVVCSELMKREPNLDLKFIAFTRDRTSEYGLRTIHGGRGFLTYLPVSSNEKMKVLWNKIQNSEYEEFALSTETLLEGHEHLKIPMIDFIMKPSENDFKVFAQQLGNQISCLKGCKLFIFSSGNSYHGYVGGLISKSWYSEYEHFLGGVPFVDQKWVSTGTGCLRWSTPSRKSSFGQKTPQLVYTMNV